MENTLHSKPSHGTVAEVSPWVRRFAPLIPNGGTVLDLASGGGRHARFFLKLGHPVVAIDRDTGPLAGLEGRAEVIRADLEKAPPPPIPGRSGPSPASSFATTCTGPSCPIFSTPWRPAAS